MARYPIQFHPEARAEAIEAIDRYRERSPAAAAAFLDEIEIAREAIQDFPETWSKYIHGTRRYLLRRFPFVIVYRVTEERIEIIAVAHGHRKPGYWAERL